MFRQWIALASLLVALLVADAPRADAGSPKSIAGIPLPPRSRPEAEGSFVSGTSFKKTVIYFDRYLKRRGLLHKRVPTYEVRGIQISRFLSEGKAAAWSAIHVFKERGVTKIFIVPQSTVETAAKN